MKSLSRIYEEIHECTKCNLYKQRLTKYYWRGSHVAKIMLIGEALGATEQERGKPFVGRSGKLLDKLLLKSGFDIENDIYITNLVKCRPPDNRNPFFDEIKACQPFLLEEIKVVKPKLIITLGRVPGDWFANGREWEWNTLYKERRWLPMYHPSYLLRNTEQRDYFPKILSMELINIGLLGR